MMKIKKKNEKFIVRDGRIIEISESRHSTVELHSSPDSCPRKQEDEAVQGEYFISDSRLSTRSATHEEDFTGM